MKITSHYLSIPPYLSTSWSNVAALHMAGEQLVVTLTDRSQIHVPNLDFDELEQIFDAHASFLENGSAAKSAREKNPRERQALSALEERLAGSSQAAPLKFNLPGIEGIGSAMQHNIEYANAPNLPREMLQKIASIVQIIAPDELAELPQPEPHCNCPHCQIARAINAGIGGRITPFQPREERDLSEGQEEVVSDEELAFEQWEIVKTGSQLYSVVNKLDAGEKYSVFLGNPVGCTCGREGCEHILAVLKS